MMPPLVVYLSVLFLSLVIIFTFVDQRDWFGWVLASFVWFLAFPVIGVIFAAMGAAAVLGKVRNYLLPRKG